MADNANVIEEFLVALGFKIDKDSEGKFRNSLLEVNTKAVAFGVSIAKLAETVAKATIDMARSLDQLYFQSIRVGSSAENIQAFTFAMQQMGGTAQDAAGALEGIASFMRNTPQWERYLGALGVATRNAVTGQLLDTEQIAENLGKALARRPFYQAAQLAQNMGISERGLLALENPEFAKQTQRYRDFSERLLGKDAIARIGDFNAKLKDMQAQFGIIVEAIGVQLLPYMERLFDWFSQLGDAINNVKDSQIGVYFNEITAALKPLIDAIVQLASTLWRVLGPALEMVGGVWFKGIIDGIHAITQLFNGLSALLRGDWSQAWTYFKQAGIDALRMVAHMMEGLLLTGMKFLSVFHKEWTDKVIGGIKSQVDAWINQNLPDVQGGEAEPSAKLPFLPPATGLGTPGRAAITPTPGTGPEGMNVPALPAARGAILDTATYAEKWLTAHGVSATAARGIAMGLFGEGGTPTAYNPAGGGQGARGIAQWRGSRLRALQARFGANPNLEQQLAFLLSELMSGSFGGAGILASQDPTTAAKRFIQNFESPDVGGGWGPQAAGDLQRGMRYAATRGEVSNTLNQQTTIYVQGATDPKVTADHVAAAQDRVNRKIIRHQMNAVG